MLSAVAGILGPNGGFRVVVGPLDGMCMHVLKGERIFIVPDFKVQEPVPPEQQREIIERARRHMLSQIAPVNHCGECKQCCKTPHISEDGLNKPSHTWCRHADEHGCSLYWKRPKPCATFKCLWLKSQDTDAPMAAELRPDKCGVILTADTAPARGEVADPDLIEVHVDRDARPSDAMVNYLMGKKTMLVTHYFGEKA